MAIGGNRCRHASGRRFAAAALLLMCITFPISTALVGYDCGGERFNITTLSLLNIGECHTEDLSPQEEEVYVQMMQLSDYRTTSAIQCKIEIDRIISYCGMHSHVSIVQGGRREYIQEIGEQACKKLHDAGTITIANAVIDRIPANATSMRSVTLAGSVTVDGKCAGAQYTDGYGTWENVIVQASLKITLRIIEASIRRATDEITMPSGTQCKLSAGYCWDAEAAETFWSPMPVDHCHFEQYDILYEGLAKKLSSKTNATTPTVYTVTTQETTFALTKTHDTDICGYKLARTEHPKLFILETLKGRTFKTRSRISVNNLDIFMYVNSKFIYVEKHIKTQLTQLYRDLMDQKCALERQILQNALTLATISPDETAYRIMKEPGYTAVVSGEVLHLVKCIPVECKIRHTENCYNELPVTLGNTSLFLLPRSHLLSSKGTPKDCNELLPTVFRVHGAWIRLTPKPVEILPPPVIQPLTHPTWQYVNSPSLATSGIYSSDDLDRLRAHIMFPVEKPSLLNIIARGAGGGNIPEGSISMLNLLDENSINRIAESAGEKAWKGFVTFGSASAGVLAIFVIIRVVKLIIDTLIHGYALHTVYGWSMHLLGAVWSSVTHLLLHLGNQPQAGSTRKTTGNPEDPMETPLPTTEAHRPAPTYSEVSEVKNPKNKSSRYSYTELRKYLARENTTDNE